MRALGVGHRGVACGPCLGDTPGRDTLITAGLALYVTSFAISLRPMFWLMISEIYPLRIQVTAMSVASIANWGSNFIVALMFSVLLAALGGASLFWIFAAIGIAGRGVEGTVMMAFGTGIDTAFFTQGTPTANTELGHIMIGG